MSLQLDEKVTSLQFFNMMYLLILFLLRNHLKKSFISKYFSSIRH